MGRTNGRAVRRAAAATALALLATPVVAVTTAAPAQAAVSRVIGLGDSFASGEGTYDYYPETNRLLLPTNLCHRSPRSWQQIVAIPGATGKQTTQVACSNATTENVLRTGQWNERPQIDAVSSANPADVVLISIGGNDVGFLGIAASCLLLPDCSPSLADIDTKINEARPKVRAVLEEVVERLPQATVVLVGYPQLVQGGCGLLSEPEGAAIDRAAVSLRRAWVGEVMAMRMGGKKVRFADTIDPFKGHGACTGAARWINEPFGADTPVEILHPTVEGNRAYATAVENVLRADPMRCTAAGCGIRFQDEWVYYTLTGGVAPVRGAIRTAYGAAGAETGPLGYPTGDEYDLVGRTGRGQNYQGGRFYYKWGSGTAFWVGGRILTKYLAAGAEAGELGYPTANAKTVTGGTGQTQQFELARMWLKNGAAQAFFSKGAIGGKYGSAGYEQGTLGYPTSDHKCFSNGQCRQDFEGRSGSEIHWASGAGAWIVQGLIRDKWAATSRENGPLGHPTGDEVAVAGSRTQTFQKGMFFWKSGSSAAYWSTGAILAKYRAERYAQGPLGWPKTDHACGLQPGNACRQHFDGFGGSVIYWTSATGAHMVTGAIRAFYASTGWQNSRPDPGSTAIAGYPVEDERILGTDTPQPYGQQRFQNGMIEIDYDGVDICWIVSGRATRCGEWI